MSRITSLGGGKVGGKRVVADAELLDAIQTNGRESRNGAE